MRVILQRVSRGSVTVDGSTVTGDDDAINAGAGNDTVVVNGGNLTAANGDVIALGDGDNSLFMVASHIAHDCVIGNNVIMANNATLGGHVHVGDFAVIGGLAAVHQFVRIGAYAVIGGMSGVESDVIPFGRVKGERAFLAGPNRLLRDARHAVFLHRQGRHFDLDLTLGQEHVHPPGEGPTQVPPASFATRA